MTPKDEKRAEPVAWRALTKHWPCEGDEEWRYGPWIEGLDRSRFEPLYTHALASLKGTEPEAAQRLAWVASPEEVEELGSLLCSVADNLGDMPVSEAWAEKTSKRAFALLGANDYFRLPAAPQAPQPEPTIPPAETAKQKYQRLDVDADVPGPLGRLRAFCSFAMNGQDWLDVEPFFDALKAEPAELRSKIAAKAMPPLLWLAIQNAGNKYSEAEILESVAERSYAMADAMLKAGEQAPEAAPVEPTDAQIDHFFNVLQYLALDKSYQYVRDFMRAYAAPQPEPTDEQISALVERVWHEFQTAPESGSEAEFGEAVARAAIALRGSKA
jgi:hypothetical protein